MSREVVIVGAKRTPIGSFQGVYSATTAPQLGAVAIRAALEQAGVDPTAVGEVLMGCVLPAGLGQAPARQAAIGAGLPLATPTTTVSKVCGSGMRAAMIAVDMIRAGSIDVAVAGGMESMTNAPYLLPKARAGYRYGHGQVLDHMALDGLENAYDGKAMGIFAESCADKYSFSREAQDAFASTSVRRALAASNDGTFAREIAPVMVQGRAGEQRIDTDEEPPKCDLDKVSKLKPAFKRDGGSVTAATSSKISDGAAALVLCSADYAQAHGLKPLARVLGMTSAAHEPEWFTTAPVPAIAALLGKLGKRADEIDLYEINEAFAVVTMAAMHDHQLPHERVNVHGGACALGHPIGATGARILVTLLNALATHDKRLGLASLCIGGGEATAFAIERL